ncbi:esterase 1, partial [Ilyonectria destructans]
IPYAEPPVGSLRFKKPTPIVTVNRTVNGRKSPRACPQGSAGCPYAGTPSDISNSTPDISEDCPQLDVVFPTSIYNARNTRKAGAPVLVWIHGGAYVSGYKNAYSRAGLITESTCSSRSGIVFVEINYRLGLFGFPPRLPGMDGISSNAGLYDQRLALQWVKDNISKFGGDPNCVTVMGESAGAGSIVA